MRRFAFVFSFVAATAAIAAVACSSSTSASCPSLSKCTGAEIAVAECNAAVAKCGASAAVFFGCYAENEVCTSSGAIDESATETAVEANCTIPAGLIPCAETLTFDGGGSSVTVSSGGTCGFSGQACCTEGGTPCDDGCCDPSTKLCVSIDEPCSGGTQCLATGTGAAGACTACGAPGQSCCPGDSCTSGCCDYDATPAVCVAAGSMCAALGTDSEVCPPEGGSCTFCGDVDSVCCPGSTCPSSTSGFTLMCDATNTCQECGGDGDACCPGDTCSETTTVCSAGTCTFCGVSGEPCCADDVCEGATCTAGTCM